MERDLAALKLDTIIDKRTQKKSISQKINDRYLNQTIKFRDPTIETLERTINNLQRLNLNFEYPRLENLSLENLKIDNLISMKTHTGT